MYTCVQAMAVLKIEITSIDCLFTVSEALKRSKMQFQTWHNRQKWSKNTLFRTFISYTIGTFAQKGSKNEEMDFLTIKM
jgi:hypothetical protein